jgi:1,2-diacylglycerol 3-beta-glucosyltransferase
MFLTAPVDTARMLVSGGGANLATWYVLSFGVAPFYGVAYWLRAGDMGVVRSLLLAHLYTLYSYFWFLAGWRAVWSVIRGQRGWAKTARTPEASSAPTAP